MTIEHLLFNALALFLVTIIIAISLAQINSHTYTLGVSNNYQFFGCVTEYDFVPSDEYIELENY